MNDTIYDLTRLVAARAEMINPLPGVSSYYSCTKLDAAITAVAAIIEEEARQKLDSIVTKP